MLKSLRLSLFSLTLLAATACTPVVTQRGNLVEDNQLEQLKIGESTRSDVLRVLGSPTAQSTFDANIWYYIGQETEKRGVLDPEITQERVIVVSFAQDGVLASVGQPQGEHEDIPYAGDKTPTHGNDISFMQQLLGNMGRFNTPQEENQ